MTKKEILEDLKKANELNEWIEPQLFNEIADEEEGFISFKLCGFNTISSSINVIIFAISKYGGIYHVSARIRNL